MEITDFKGGTKKRREWEGKEYPMSWMKGKQAFFHV